MSRYLIVLAFLAAALAVVAPASARKPSPLATATPSIPPPAGVDTATPAPTSKPVAGTAVQGEYDISVPVNVSATNLTAPLNVLCVVNVFDPASEKSDSYGYALSELSAASIGHGAPQATTVVKVKALKPGVAGQPWPRIEYECSLLEGNLPKRQIVPTSSVGAGSVIEVSGTADPAEVAVGTPPLVAAAP